MASSTLIIFRWILVLVVFGITAFTIYRQAKKSRVKENLSNWNEIVKSKGVKENILFGITMLSSFILLITPCFTVMEFSFFGKYSFSGFAFIFDHSEDFFDIFDEWVIPFLIASIAIAIFTSGLEGVAWTTFSHFNGEKSVSSNRFPISACLITAGYMILSLSIANIIEEENYGLLEVSSATHIPFIFECILLIVFLIFKYGIPDEMFAVAKDSHTPPQNANEVTPVIPVSTEAAVQQSPTAQARDIVHELKLYKELLDCGIITQEEFDNQKEALLKLTSN